MVHWWWNSITRFQKKSGKNVHKSREICVHEKFNFSKQFNFNVTVFIDKFVYCRTKRPTQLGLDRREKIAKVSSEETIAVIIFAHQNAWKRNKNENKQKRWHFLIPIYNVYCVSDAFMISLTSDMRSKLLAKTVDSLPLCLPFAIARSCFTGVLSAGLADSA